jgi:hypothetical protein
VRRRIYLIGAAVAALSLVVGVGAAFAVKNHKHPHPAPLRKPKIVLLSCVMNLSTVPPEGQANVDQPPSDGDTYGANSCPGNSMFGSGMAHTAFTVPDSGDTVGTYQEYFKTGMVSGSFDITPNESPPINQTGFYSQTWTGTIGLEHATGSYTGITAVKNTGVLNCSTEDSGVHMTCTERIKISIPPPVSATGTTALR